MYVRWKKRVRRRYEDGSTNVSLCAVLVKSARVGGRPRQKAVRHLASIQGFLVDYLPDRYAFLGKLEHRLNLAVISREITAEQRQSIEDKIALTVPPPSEEYVRWLAENGSALKRWEAGKRLRDWFA